MQNEEAGFLRSAFCVSTSAFPPTAAHVLHHAIYLKPRSTRWETKTLWPGKSSRPRESIVATGEQREPGVDDDNAGCESFDGRVRQTTDLDWPGHGRRSG